MIDMTNPNENSEFMPEENEIKAKLWSIDSVLRDGQVSAGEDDKEYQEFLKTTTWVD